jgi:hypothetical protein
MAASRAQLRWQSGVVAATLVSARRYAASTTAGIPTEPTPVAGTGEAVDPAAGVPTGAGDVPCVVADTGGGGARSSGAPSPVAVNAGAC